MNGIVRYGLIGLVLLVLGPLLLLQFGGIAFTVLGSLVMNRAQELHDRTELPRFSGTAAALNAAEGPDSKRLRDFVNGTHAFNARRAVAIERTLPPGLLLQAAGRDPGEATMPDAEWLDALQPLKERDCAALEKALPVNCTPLSFTLDRSVMDGRLLQVSAVYAIQDREARKPVAAGARIDVETVRIVTAPGADVEQALGRISAACRAREQSCAPLTAEIHVKAQGGSLRSDGRLVLARF